MSRNPYPMPPKRADGSCSACAGGWNCVFHQVEGLLADDRRAEAIAGASRALHEMEIARTCARYELERDEFQTREE